MEVGQPSYFAARRGRNQNCLAGNNRAPAHPGLIKPFGWQTRGPVERCKLNVVRWKFSWGHQLGRLLENVQRTTHNAQRSEVILLDECSFQSSLKAGR